MLPALAITFLLLQAAPAAGLPTVDALVAKNIAARGGQERLLAVKTQRLTGRMTIAPGTEAPITIEMKRPNKVRLEFRFQGYVGVQAFDGETAWHVLPFRGKDEAEILDKRETEALRQQADFDGPLVGWRDKGLKVELVGQETYQDAPAYRLRVTFPDGSLKDLWLDAAKGLERKSESMRRVGGETLVGESLVEDYRDVQGLMMPHAFENGPKNAVDRQKLTLTKIELNPELDDARFSMPKPPSN
jgi:hypothetical protein